MSSFGRVTWDYETQSYADLTQVGAWNYSLHPSTKIICLCFRIRHANGDRDVGDWVPGSPMPDCLRKAIEAGYEVEAHNYGFEYAITANIAVPRHGFCPVMPEQWRCSMAVANYYAMPAALDSLCRALRLPGKDPEGSRLISKYCKLHLKSAKEEIPPEDLAKFIAYCHRDCEIEEAVSDYLGDLPEREMQHFQIDQDINLRGLNLDIDGITAASLIVDKRAEELTARFQALTGLNPTQGAKLLTWFTERGVKLDNMQAGYLEDLIEEGAIPAGECREALTIRLQVNKASTKKLDAMARHRAPDGRARWQVRYHGAQTGRDTASGFGTLNLTRGLEDVEPQQLVRDIMYGDPAWLDALYGDATAAVSAASRHWIRAQDGHTLFAGDFVSIEAVMQAWLAGEEWKVQAFRDKKFIYGLTACKIHMLDPALADDKAWFKANYPKQAKDGKTGELAWGYGGGLGAWLKFDRSGRHTDEAIEEMKKKWRAEHPATTANWRGLEDAAIEAVSNPGSTRGHRQIGFQIVDEWLSIILPNGKRIWYREPELRTGMPIWHRPETDETCAAGDCKCRPMVKLTYMAQKEGQWKRVSTYGPKIAENVTQASSREYLMASVHAAKKARYPVILKVYDEVVAEPKIGFGSPEEFLDILKNAPGREWAAGIPIDVDGGDIGPCYRK